jgi:hypothetical protein
MKKALKWLASVLYGLVMIEVVIMISPLEFAVRADASRPASLARHGVDGIVLPATFGDYHELVP